MSETDQRDWWLTGADRPASSEIETVPVTVLDAITDPFYVYDRYGNLVEWNDAFREMSGYSDAELGDFDPFQLVAPADRDRVRSGLARVAAGEEITLDVTFEAKDGERKPHEVTASPFRDDDGNVVGLVGTARCIAERKEREEQLRQYERIIETVGDGVYLLNADREFVRVNQALADMLGYTPDELVGTHITDVLTEAALETAERYRRLAAESDRPVVTFENELVRADGETVPVETRFSRLPESDEHVTLGLVRDIRDRRERGQLLEQLHEGTRELMTAETVAEVAETTAELAQRHFEYATTEVRLLRDDRLEMVAVETDRPELRERKPPYEVGEGFVGRAYEQGEPTVVSDLPTADSPHDYDPMRSAMVLPVEGWGTIAIAAGERDAFDDRDLEIGQVFAADARLAFELAAREQEVREQNRELEQYGTLVETMSDGVYMTDEDLRLTAVNGAMAEMLGADRDFLRGKRISDVTDAETAAEIERLYQRLRASDADVVSHETVATGTEGETAPVEIRFSLLPGDGPPGLVGVVRDVTERVEHEQEIRETKERLQMALESADLGVWDWHLDADEVTFDDRWAEMLGYSLEQLEESYETWAEHAHPDDISVAESELARHLAGESDYYRAEYRMQTKDGEWRWIRDLGRVVERDENGHAVRAVGVHWDVTERVERERELRETKDRLELAFEGAELGLWDWHIPSEEITINDRWAEMHGYAPEDIADPYETWTDHVHPEDLPAAKAAVRQNIIGESEYYQMEYRMVTNDGEKRWMRDHGRVVERDEDGHAVRAIGVHWDVTERKEREERVRRQRDELETLDRINELVQETIGALASAVSREQIEETVCTRLGSSSLYKMVAIGGRSPGSDTVNPRATAGEGTSYFDDVSVPTDTDSLGSGPAARAIETGEVTVIHDIESDPLFEAFREAALARDFRSVAVVPLTHGTVVHGVLAVYADRMDAFSEREIQAFAVLGEMVGFAISATQDRRLIEADTALELAFRVTDDTSLLARLSNHVGAPCDLLGSAKATEGETLHYVAVPAAAADAVTDAVPDAEVRRVRTDDAEAVFEIRHAESLSSLLRAAGVRPVEGTAEHSTVDIVAEAPQDVDVRAVIDRLESTYDTVSLLSKQEGDHRQQPRKAACEDVLDQLTDRQHAALAAAYFGGYYDWPRDSTAEEIADSLGVTPPTFHQHLRCAQEKAVRTLLGD
ncbi:PAS domain S-box protein [Halorientalis litorea]|uniref:PAS domain S-box protein n=1 Tax=Halorientalis litorea TaxID=2931977 RepID=UPI001FF4EEFB|nr:PAS domain S-box protein [Halorientalis litorea]